MIYYADLSSDQRKAYRDALLGSKSGQRRSQQRWHFEIWYRNLTFAAPVYWQGSGPQGQVDIDATQAITRSASLFVPDPGHNLGVATHANFLDRLLRCEHWCWVDGWGIDGYVAAPVLTGPITKADRAAHGIAVEAQGIEQWCMGSISGSHQWKKGARVTDVIRFILHQICGIPLGRLAIPDLPKRLPSTFGLFGDLSKPKGKKAAGIAGLAIETWWGACQYLAALLDADLFPNGYGHVVLRRRSDTSVFHWTSDGAMLSVPQTSTLIGGQSLDATSVVNNVLVVGRYVAKKKGTGSGGGSDDGGSGGSGSGGDGASKPPPVIAGEWTAPPGNRFAPGGLGFPDGVGLLKRQVMQAPHVSTNKQADALAKSIGLRKLRVAQTQTFDSAIVPFLEEWQTCKADGKKLLFTQASIPFVFSPDSPMSVGYLRHYTLPREANRA